MYLDQLLEDFLFKVRFANVHVGLYLRENCIPWQMNVAKWLALVCFAD